ncbi:hypothetical protein GQ53DRAFT_318970 [Thozetella sp. PMI_491]|nr:hypothetical protein GQ53DRAFT_318970 [Thozetella sp. PMI_491]
MHYNMSIPREQPVARQPGSMKPRVKSTHGQFDPDELSRRLYVVLAEQKVQSERRRRARAEIAANGASAGGQPQDPRPVPSSSRAKHQLDRRPGENGADLISELRRSKPHAPRDDPRHADAHPGTSGEPYVPQEAAKQFARTTTVENMQGGLVHKLSKRAMKFHMEGAKANRTHEGDPSLAPHEQERALRAEQTRREKVLDRNRFQNTRILEEAAEADEERKQEEERRRHRHTFEGELSKMRRASNERGRAEWRNSAGDVLDRVEGNRRSILVDPAVDPIHTDTTPPEELDRHQASEHRVDWTQSDETKQRPKLLLTPLLRKADSIWTLRTRLGSKGSSQDKGDSSPEHSLKSPKPSFFARLRR